LGAANPKNSERVNESENPDPSDKDAKQLFFAHRASPSEEFPLF
jgi:hypothetical protein